MNESTMTNNLTQKAAAGTEVRDSSCPMRVVLMSERGDLFTSWLPKNMEGRYKFLDSSGLSPFPIYVEAKNGNWTVFSGKNGVFYVPGPEGTDRIRGQEEVLTGTTLLNLRYRDEEFLLYAEYEHPGDRVFVPYLMDPAYNYSIGRSDQNEICVNSQLVSRRHASLHWNGTAWTIQDHGSLNGTYVNGMRRETAELRVGDVIFIMGLYLIIGAGMLSVNSGNGRVTIFSPGLRPIGSGQEQSVIPEGKRPSSSRDFFDRKPRKLTPVKERTIEIEPPPTPIGANSIPLLLRLGSPMLMGGRALMTGNVFMALSSLVIPSLTQGLTEKDRKEYEQKRLKGYREYLRVKRTEIMDEKYFEESQLNVNYPPVNEVAAFAENGDRLWERRKTDEDFLDIRIGNGRIPLIAQKEYTPRKFELEPDILTEEMYALAEQKVMLDEAPIMISLTEDFVIGVSGTRRNIWSLMDRIIFQTVFTHSCDEVKLIILARNLHAVHFDYVRYLPHNWDNERTIRFFASSGSDVQRINQHLVKELENRKAGEPYDVRKGVSYVVLAFSKSLFQHLEPLQEALSSDQYMGISIIAAFQGLPKECRKIIDVEDRFKLIDYLHPDVYDQLFRKDSCDREFVRKGLKQLSGLHLMMDSDLYDLPDMVTFLEMFDVGKVEHLNPVQRWTENNPVKSLAAPVGTGTGGDLFMLDLHEKKQGPHGLVAGMTGSGKSEFLITYILSMAVNYSPDEVAFVLIDYKGGGLADAFEDPSRGIHLPHLIGTITNLDGAAIQRSLLSINSELKRRQEIFKRAKSQANEGTMDIYDYQKLYRSHRVSEPLPHLFIISDEFAELKAQEPEFMNELISIARIGRSLGVHLILATQKPGGVVTDQIRSNTKFQVCLKVQDRADSMDMIKRPDAAELKQTGRFYLQVGYSEFFAKGQSAWCGAEYVPQEETVVEEHAVQFIDNTGQVILETRPEVRKAKTGLKQIVVIVKYLSDLAVKENIEPRRLWLDPLPKLLDYAQWKEECPPVRADQMEVLMGKVDDPEKQSQYPMVMSMLNMHHLLICGTGGSGKSTFLKTMLTGFVEQYGPEDLNYYILDLSAGAMNAFRNLPHCGAYLTENNEADIDRLFNLLDTIIQDRKQRFLEADVTSFEAYRSVGRIPLILMIIDGYTNIKSLKRGNDYYNEMHEYLRESSNYGIRYILTCNHNNEVHSRSKQEIDLRIALKAKDKYDYADILDMKCSLLPADAVGRGVCVYDGRPLEFQTAAYAAEQDEQQRAALLREHLQELARRYEGQAPARMLPVMDDGQEYSDFCRNFTRERIPLGYATVDLRQVAIPFQQFYTASVYLGNPAGVLPVISNFVEAGRHNGMDLVLMRRGADSLLDSEFQNTIRKDYPGRITVLESSAEGLAGLDDLLVEEIVSRNIYRDQHSKENGIPLTESGRAKKAARYIRAHTKPVLILFESYGDFCRLEKDENMVIEMTSLLSKTRGYNIYFVGFFYPNEEGNLSMNPLMKCFNKDELLMLFGGQYDKQGIASLPMDYRRIEQINPKYDRYLLKYRGEYHTMLMPCGELQAEETDPEEAPII